jgi:DNA-binding FadR family transcriptional regulator
MNIKVEPAQRTPLADTVAGQLKTIIKSGRYKSGDQLPTEPELMQQLGVGRSTVREAVRILSNCGLVNVKQGLGTFVVLDEGLDEPLHQRLKRANPTDLREVRQLLEIKAAEKAALNRTQKDIIIMAALLKKRKSTAEKQEVMECIEVDVQFHIAVAEASKNEILADLYKTVAVQIKKMFASLSEDTTKFLAMQQLHEDLLQAIVDEDPQLALAHATRINELSVIA